MNKLCLVSLLAPTLILSVAFGQSVSEGDTPQEKVDSYLSYGSDFMLDGEYEKAVACYHKALAIDPKLVIIELAEAYFVMGKPNQAEEIFRKALTRDPVFQDLTFKTAAFPSRPAFFYSILLARRGQEEEAKAMYYLGLRKLYVKGMLDVEPLPLLVVFDAEPAAEVWQYSPRLLESAALMGLVILPSTAIDQTRKNLARVLELRPGWPMPYFYRAFRSSDSPESAKDFDEAERLTRSDGGRTILRKLREWKLGERPPPPYAPGSSLREKLPLLEEARKRLLSQFGKSL